MNSLDHYDFDNVMTVKVCTSGNPRLPVDLFDNYTLLEDRSPLNKGTRQVSPFALYPGHSLSDLDFPLHLYTRRELIEVTLMIFAKYQGVEVMHTDEATLRNLVTEIAL